MTTWRRGLTPTNRRPPQPISMIRTSLSPFVARGEDSSDEDSAAAASSVAVPRVPTAAEAVAGLETALPWFETRDIDSLKLMQLQNLKAIAKHAQYEGGKKQQKLTAFFAKPTDCSV